MAVFNEVCINIVGSEASVSKEQSGMSGRMKAVSELAEGSELIFVRRRLNDQVFVTIGEDVKKGDGMNFIKTFV